MANRKKRKHFRAPTCPYCEQQAVCRDSSMVYGKSHGRIWICPNYPQCDSYVGCHRGTKQPMGRMANGELRLLRRKSHAAFDSLWKSGLMNRTQAYKWLADALMIPQKQCHVGMFDAERCREAIRVCENAPHKRVDSCVESSGVSDCGR